MAVLKRTSLFSLHSQLGARMTEFAGFEMPLNYSGIIDEHRAVRASAGLFDLSHMGEFEISGAGASAALERALTNSAARLKAGQAQYSILCAPDGGTIDDLIVYRLGDERYLLCVNASNITADREWLIDLCRERAELRDLSAETALVAVQGPNARAIVADLASGPPVHAIARFGFACADVAGLRCMIARTGYTGEDGFELFVAAGDAKSLFSAILDAGRKAGLKPCGLGARDTLRLEAGLPLYGHELDRATTPMEAGLGAFVRFGRGFIGEEAITTRQARGQDRRLIGIVTDDRKSIARRGYRTYVDGREAGIVTSGTFAPTIGRPIAMVYLANAPRFETAAGAKIEVEIRGRRAPATILKLPVYRRQKSSNT